MGELTRAPGSMFTSCVFAWHCCLQDMVLACTQSGLFEGEVKWLVPDGEGSKGKLQNLKHAVRGDRSSHWDVCTTCLCFERVTGAHEEGGPVLEGGGGVIRYSWSGCLWVLACAGCMLGIGLVLECWVSPKKSGCLCVLVYAQCALHTTVLKVGSVVA